MRHINKAPSQVPINQGFTQEEDSAVLRNTQCDEEEERSEYDEAMNQFREDEVIGLVNFDSDAFS